MPLARLFACSASPSLVCLRVTSRFLVRPQVLTRIYPLSARGTFLVLLFARLSSWLMS